MSKINVRSPYFIYDNSTTGGMLASATLTKSIQGNSSTHIQETPILTNIYCNKWTLLLLKYLNCKRLHLKTLLMEITTNSF